MTFQKIVSSLLVLLLSLFIVPDASAHATQPRVEISVERMTPGGVVDVRGVSFDMDENITLALLGTGVEIPLGDIFSNAEGEFIYIAVLPENLSEGTYYFRANSSHHWVISPPLKVWGMAISEGGGQGSREEADGLLAPMPTMEGTVPAAALTSVPQVPVDEATPSRNWNTNILILGLLLSILAAALVGLKKRTVR